MNAFAWGLAVGISAINSVAGELVTYARGASQDDFTAVPSNSEFDLTNSNGITTTFQSKDFIFINGLLVLDGEPITPEQRDLIIQTKDGLTTTYEVLPATTGRQFRYCDSYRIGIRVHTKQIKQVPAL